MSVFITHVLYLSNLIANFLFSTLKTADELLWRLFLNKNEFIDDVLENFGLLNGLSNMKKAASFEFRFIWKYVHYIVTE